MEGRTKDKDLDEEIVRYFERIDEYQRQWGELAKCFSSGFMSLAQANFKSNNGRRYDSEYYDERMETIRGVDISQDVSGHRFKVVEYPPAYEATSTDIPQKEDETLRKRKATSSESRIAEQTEDKGEKDSEETEVKPKVDSRDPLRWFGILVPQDLRDCQKQFTNGLSKCLDVLTVMSEISEAAKRIEELQGKVVEGDVDPELLAKLEEVDNKEEAKVSPEEEEKLLGKEVEGDVDPELVSKLEEVGIKSKFGTSTDKEEA